MSLHDRFHHVQRAAQVAAVPPLPVGTHSADPRPMPAPSLIERAQPVLSDDFVIDLVAQHDLAPAATRSGGNREGFLHLSSLIGMCPREHAISQQHGTPTFKTVSGAMKIVWRIGRAVETHIRNGIISSRNWQGVYGKWMCRCEASSHIGLHPTGRTCPVCVKGINNYREPGLISSEYGVIGSPDVTLVEMGFYVVIEIKSMTKDDFDALERPLADHILQACGYRHLYALMGYPVHDKVKIIYGRKDFKFGGPKAVYKEYTVHAPDWQGQINDMFDQARLVRQAYLARTLPPRICDTIECRRARDCERKALCFSLNR